MSKKEDIEKKKKIEALKQRRQEALENETGKAHVQRLNAGNQKQDAAQEQKVAARYKNDFDPRTVVPEGGPQPGVTGKGTFSLYQKNKKKK